MSKKNKMGELRALSLDELHDKLNKVREEYFSFRMKAQRENVMDYSQFKKLRSDIARLLTIKQEKQK